MKVTKFPIANKVCIPYSLTKIKKQPSSRSR